MVGILILSHGKLAEGLLESGKLFFGEDVPGIETLCLEGQDVDVFDDQLDRAIKRLDDGSGVLVLCDIFGGTPANRSAYKVSNKVKVVTGVNMAMILDALGRRMNARNIDEIDIKHIMESGRKSIVCINEFYQKW